MTSSPARILTVLAAVLLLPGVVFAIDSRFELDLRMLDSRPSRTVAPPEASAEARVAKKTVRASNSLRSVKKEKSRRRFGSNKSVPVAAAEETRYGLKLLDSPRYEREDGLDMVERIWDELLPGAEEARHEVDLETGQFMLSLDPKKYPVFAAADGGRILVDRERGMPPLVKSLLTQNEPDIRIIAENPADVPRFVRAMLNAAGFYSLEENFDCGFGEDPKLLVHADYKIERDAESLLDHDMILLNVGRHRSRMPESLVGFLNNKGFQVVESVPRTGARVEGLGEIHQILADDPEKIADSLMGALAISFERDRNLALGGFSEQGIDLKIRADRYFESRGRGFVVSYFNGDPVTYTLIRLMETNGYRVIVLDSADTLQTISQKFNSRLQLGGEYGVHKLLNSGDLPYGIEMSGMVMQDAGRRKTVVVTNRSVELLTRELAELNGYTVFRY